MSGEEFILTFSPAQLCHATECERITTWGLAEPWENDHIHLTPYCFEHGFCEAPTYREPTEEDIRREHDCITRFVVGYHEGQGQATVLGECDIHEVPPPFEFEPNPESYGFEDRSWWCEWRNGEEVKRLTVVWDTWNFVFSLYPLSTD